MAISITLMQGVSSQGIRVKHFGDLVVVTMPGAAFATTARDHIQAQQWARARASHGNLQRDRTAYCDQHRTLLARKKGGIATRGSVEAVAGLVKIMRECGISLSEWAVPAGVYLGDSNEG